jgi:hypothetical protein
VNRTIKQKAVAGMILVTAFLVLGACGGKPFTPEKIGEVKAGPGLFTGKKGGIIISPSSN